VLSQGGGRFSHRDGRILFSTRDGSDPLSNGRSYFVSYPAPDLASLYVGTDTAEAGDAEAALLAIGSERITPVKGVAYGLEMPAVLAGWSSDADSPATSRLVLLEDGHALGPAHASRRVIAKTGLGAYRHTGGTIEFSTSDNSDPRANGRQYAIGLRPEPRHHYADWRARHTPRVDESLDAPVLVWPAEGERIDTARPTFRVANPDPSLLYYFELDVSPSMDSAALHRRPGVRRTRNGIDPTAVLDRDPQFDPAWTVPYRLGAIAPMRRPLGDPLAARHIALRLGYGLSPGREKIREVWEYVRAQYYPADDVGFRRVSDTLKRDRGYCASINLLGARLLEELGYSTRRLTLRVPRFKAVHALGNGQHSSAEVYFDGSWSIFDPYLQFWLPGTSFGRLARDASLPDYPALRMSRNPDIAALLRDLSDEQLEISLRDYAQDRVYDRFDSLSRAAVVEDEIALFAGEPRYVADPSFETLWDDPVMSVSVRVRGLQVSQDQLVYVTENRARRSQVDEPIHATPWTRVDFEIDLRRAYGVTTADGTRTAAAPPLP
jgi:hypothetical protein